MKRVLFLLCAVFMVLGVAGGAAAKDIHMAYEMAVFKAPSGPQAPGAHLNGPGDMYRYTYFINDKYINNPNFVLKRAGFGVHIIDPEYSKESGDGPKEWGRILIDGKPQKWGFSSRNPDYRKGQTPALTDLVEMESDDEMVAGLPPYIFNVTDLVKDDHTLVLEVINVRQDGSIDGNALFGDFIVLRAGLHLFYAPVEK